MFTTKKILSLTPLAVILLGLVTYNFIGAQWTAPVGTPPAGNVEAPLNTSATTQLKLGALGTGALSVTGHALITSVNPLLKLADTNGIAMWLYTDNRYTYFLADRDGDQNTIEAPYPMAMYVGPDVSTDFVQFPNQVRTAQVRATQYCDAAGGNCFGAASVSGGSVTNPNSVNRSCAALPVCGSAGDTNKALDCRVSGATNSYGGGPLCVTRSNVTPAMTWGEASQACIAMHGSGYRLPSRTEGLVLFTQRVNIGNIIAGTDESGAALATPWAYWTGVFTDSNDGRMGYIWMTSTGGHYGQYGTRPSNVRCVRGDLL